MDARFSRLFLVPVGDSPLTPIREMAADLSDILGLTTNVSDSRLPLPEEAYDIRRGQTLAPRILSMLRSARGRSSALLLGVGNSDIFAPGLSFVFGQADILGGVAVVSMTRLYPAFHGRPHDLGTFRRRNAIEGVHEVGHLLGLSHCSDTHCVMFFSSTITDSDRKGPLFCHGCRGLAARSVVPDRELDDEVAIKSTQAADGPRESGG